MMQTAVQLNIAIDLQVKYNFSCLFILLRGHKNHTRKNEIKQN